MSMEGPEYPLHDNINEVLNQKNKELAEQEVRESYGDRQLQTSGSSEPPSEPPNTAVGTDEPEPRPRRYRVRGIDGSWAWLEDAEELTDQKRYDL